MSNREEIILRLIAGLILSAVGYLTAGQLLRCLFTLTLCLYSIAKTGLAVILIAAALLLGFSLAFGPVDTAPVKEAKEEPNYWPKELAPSPKFAIGDPRRYGGTSPCSAAPTIRSVPSTGSVSSDGCGSPYCGSTCDSEPSTAPTSLFSVPFVKTTGKSLFDPVNAAAFAIVEAAAANQSKHTSIFPETSYFSPVEFAAILAATPKPSLSKLAKKRVHGLEDPLVTYYEAPIFSDLSLVERLRNQLKNSQVSADDRSVDALPGRQRANTRWESRQQRSRRLHQMLNLSRHAPLENCTRCDGTGTNPNGYNCHECFSFFNHCSCDICLSARHPAQFIPRRCSEWNLDCELRCNRPLATHSEHFCSHHAISP